MKILQNAVLSLVFLVPVFTLLSDDTEMNNVITSLQDMVAVLATDASQYATLHEEIGKMAQEFDTSSEIRRRLQCCITYTFDNLNQTFSHREGELIALLAQKDQEIADLQERFEILKEQVAQEMQDLANTVDALTQELSSFRNMRDSTDVQPQVEQSPAVAQLCALVAQLQGVVIALNQERALFLSNLEELANKTYGHFEMEAIENTVFGERICGTLYCPDLDDASIMVDLVDVETVSDVSAEA